MFQNLRSGAYLYILFKGKAELKKGEIVSVSTPVPINQGQQPNIYQPQRMCADYKVKLDDGTIDLQRIPLDVAYAELGDDLFVCDNEQMILPEVRTQQNRLRSIIDNIDNDKKLYSKYSALVERLDPKAKEDARVSREIDNIKTDIQYIKDALSQMMKSKNDIHELDRNKRTEVEQGTLL